MMTDAQRAWSAQTPQNLAALVRGLKSFEHTQFAMDTREDVDGPFCRASVIYRENGDIVFQLFPHARGFPTGADPGRAFLADALEVYFGSLDRFSASHIPELSSWAVRAKGLAETPMYDKDHHIYGFLSYLNQPLADLQ